MTLQSPQTEVRTLSGWFGDPLLLQYTIDYPFVRAGGPACTRINGFLSAQARAFERYCCGAALEEARSQHRALSESFSPLQLTVSSEVMRCDSALLSGFADSYRRMGARGERLTRMSRTFSLRTGNALPLSALFRPHTPWAQTLTSAVTAELRRRAQTEPGSYFTDAPARAARMRTLHNYYLADDGLVLWFPQGALAPLRTGLPSFLVRYEAIQSLLSAKL